MAFNLDDLMMDLEAVCSRHWAELAWDPSHQTRRGNETRLSFSLNFQRGHDDGALLPLEKQRHLLLRLVSKLIFEFFGSDASYDVTLNPGRTFERRVEVTTPKALADGLSRGTTVRLTSISIPCVITVTTRASVNEDVGLHPAERAERLMNSLIAIGAGKQLFVTARSEPDPGNRDDPNRIMCLLYAEHELQDMDAIAPPKVRLRSFANAVRQQLERIEEEGVTTHLSIGAHLAPKRITPKDLSDLIAGGYGSSSMYIFRVGFELFYP